MLYNLFQRLVMLESLSLLIKKDYRCWDRSGDLESHGPARSLGATRAQGCRMELSGLVFSSSWSLYDVVGYEALLMHLFIRDI